MSDDAQQQQPKRSNFKLLKEHFESRRYKPTGRQNLAVIIQGLYFDGDGGEPLIYAPYINEEGEEDGGLFARCDLTPEGQAEFDRRLNAVREAFGKVHLSPNYAEPGNAAEEGGQAETVRDGEHGGAND